MRSGLEVRICTLTEIVVGGETVPTSVLEIDGHADASEGIAERILGLEFNGNVISSDTTELRNAIRVARNAGFPGTDVLIVGPASGLRGEQLRLAGERALAVKQLLLEAGVPAENLAADTPVASAMAEV